MNSPAPAPVSSATINVNGVCYTGTPEATLEHFGESAKMGMSIGGIILTCICLILFIYISMTSPSVLPKIMAVCCACSLASSGWQYITSKMAIDSMEKSGKIRNC